MKLIASKLSTKLFKMGNNFSKRSCDEKEVADQEFQDWLNTEYQGFRSATKSRALRESEKNNCHQYRNSKGDPNPVPGYRIVFPNSALESAAFSNTSPTPGCSKYWNFLEEL